jgi:hypothetical protein
MNLKKFEALGLIETATFSHKQIIANLNRAQKDLLTAAANLKIDEAWAYTIAYHAMLRAARALMFAHGYRPKRKGQHKTSVEFSSEILGQDFLHLTSRLIGCASKDMILFMSLNARFLKARLKNH